MHLKSLSAENSFYFNNVILIEKSLFVILKFLIQMHWSIDQINDIVKQMKRSL